MSEVELVAAHVPGGLLAGALFALCSTPRRAPFWRQAACWTGLVAAGLAAWCAVDSPPRTPAALALVIASYLAAHAVFFELRRWSWLGLLFLTPVAVLGALVALLVLVPARPWTPARLGLLAGALGWTVLSLAALSAVARRRFFPEPGLAPGHERVLERMAECLFPPLPGTPFHAGQADLGRRFSEFAAQAPWLQRLGVGLGVELIELAPLLLGGRPRRFSSLPPPERTRVLEHMEGSRFLLLQMVFYLFKTGLSLLYYERAEVMEELGAPQDCLQRKRPPPPRTLGR